MSSTKHVMESTVGPRVESVVDCAIAIQEYNREHTEMVCETLGSREQAHAQANCYSPLNGRQPIFALLGHDDIRTLEGKLLTIMDASFTDREQRKAAKDLVRNAIWFNWVPYLDTDDKHVGKPDSRY